MAIASLHNIKPIGVLEPVLQLELPLCCTTPLIEIVNFLVLKGTLHTAEGAFKNTCIAKYLDSYGALQSTLSSRNFSSQELSR